MTPSTPGAGEGMGELIARLEKATGPDRQLDFCVSLVSEGKNPREYKWNPEFVDAMPLYTASVDAALTLVPRGWTWALSSAFAIDAYLTFHRKGSLAGIEKEVEVHDAVSAPLALCIAALKARATPTPEER